MWSDWSRFLNHARALLTWIVSYWGDPDSRLTMEFHDSVWLPYTTQDIFQMIQYEDFCNNTPGLYFLQYSSSIAEKTQKEVNKQPITSLQPEETIYVDLRTWGAKWYQSIGLPDMYTTRCYVDKWEITAWKKEPVSLYGRKVLRAQSCWWDAGSRSRKKWSSLHPRCWIFTHCCVHKYSFIIT